MTSVFLQVRSNGQITLPTSVRRLANLREGDLLEVIVDEDGSLRLVPKPAVDRSQAYFWTDRWQLGEMEAEDDLQEGGYQEFSNLEALADDLETDREDELGTVIS